MSNPKFKDQLVENVATIVKIVERGNVSQGNFGTTHWHKLSVNGQVFDHGASESEMNALGLLNVGEEVQAVKKKNNFGTMSVYWSPKDGAEARMNANPQPMGNTGMARQDKKLDEYKDAQEEKSIAISIQGFMQAFIIQGQKIGEALTSAVKAREACLRKAKEIHSGIPEMKHDPVTAAEAAAAFAPDTQSTL